MFLVLQQIFQRHENIIYVSENVVKVAQLYDRNLVVVMDCKSIFEKILQPCKFAEMSCKRGTWYRSGVVREFNSR